MDKPLSQIFTEAADLVAKRGGWTQQEYARDAKGRPSLSGGNAVCFCALGAVNMASSQSPLRDNSPAKDWLRGVIGGSILRWNDDPERTQAEVVAALRKAAELAKERGL